jgi:hypothetical protein
MVAVGDLLQNLASWVTERENLLGGNSAVIVDRRSMRKPSVCPDPINQLVEQAAHPHLPIHVVRKPARADEMTPLA